MQRHLLAGSSGPGHLCPHHSVQHRVVVQHGPYARQHANHGQTSTPRRRLSQNRASRGLTVQVRQREDIDHLSWLLHQASLDPSTQCRRFTVLYLSPQHSNPRSCQWSSCLAPMRKAPHRPAHAATRSRTTTSLGLCGYPLVHTSTRGKSAGSTPACCVMRWWQSGALAAAGSSGVIRRASGEPWRRRQAWISAATRCRSSGPTSAWRAPVAATMRVGPFTDRRCTSLFMSVGKSDGWHRRSSGTSFLGER